MFVDNWKNCKQIKLINNTVHTILHKKEYNKIELK